MTRPKQRRYVLPPVMHSLTEIERQVLTLCGGHGYTYDEAAKELGKSYHTIKHELHNARKKLRVSSTLSAWREMQRRERGK